MLRCSDELLPDFAGSVHLWHVPSLPFYWADRVKEVLQHHHALLNAPHLHQELLHRLYPLADDTSPTLAAHLSELMETKHSQLHSHVRHFERVHPKSHSHDNQSPTESI